MHQTRLQRFTSALKQFKKKVKRGQREYAGAFTVKKPDNPSQKIPLISDDCLTNTHELRWGVEAILECKVEKDFLNENMYNVIQHLKKQKNDRFKRYRQITNDYTSRLWKNADQESAPLYVESLRKNSRTSTVDPEIYPFRPFPEESLLSHIQRIRNFIHQTPSKDYHNRLARKLFNDLSSNLFIGLSFPKEEKLHFMREKRLVVPREKTWKSIKRLPGRFPIDMEICCKLILLSIDRFIASQKPLYAETLLYIWLAQSAARWEKRGFEVNEILTIHHEALRTTTIMHESFQAKEHKISFGNKKSFLISSSLKEIVQAYADRRSSEAPILKMHPFSIANCLKELGEALELDNKSFPITPETFIEAAHPIIGHRYLPFNTQKKSL